MRIISGNARGRKLSTPPQKDNSIRPTADRAREALFNILGQRIKNSQVLDLFAGTGALGLEALSRGARQVVFIDNGQLSLNIIKKNISIFPEEFKNDHKCIVIKDNLQRPAFLLKLPNTVLPQFDIIFADPPYDQELSSSILRFIDKHNLLKADGVIVIEERHTIDMPVKLPSLELTDTRKYGEACFSFYKATTSV